MLQHNLLHDISIYMLGSCHAWLLHIIHVLTIFRVYVLQENCWQQPVSHSNLDTKLHCCPGSHQSWVCCATHVTKSTLQLYSYVSILQCVYHVSVTLLVTMETLWHHHGCRGNPVASPWMPWKPCGITMDAVETLWHHHGCRRNPVASPWMPWKSCGITMDAMKILWHHHGCCGNPVATPWMPWKLYGITRETLWHHHGCHGNPVALPWMPWKPCGIAMDTLWHHHARATSENCIVVACSRSTCSTLGDHTAFSIPFCGVAIVIMSKCHETYPQRALCACSKCVPWVNVKRDCQDTHFVECDVTAFSPHSLVLCCNGIFMVFCKYQECREETMATSQWCDRA